MAHWKRGILGLLIVGAVSLIGCQKEVGSATSATGPVTLAFRNMVGTDPLAFGTVYTSPFGEAFTVTKFKYYITNIELLNTTNGRKQAFPDSYFLVDHANPSSQTIRVDAASGSYNAVSFLVGVDSIRNVSGAQTGALDPLMDMFWTWNSGYIMAKLEGNAPVSTLPNQMIEYHIGGFKGPNSAIRRVTLQFPSGLEREVIRNSTLVIDINTDLRAWFQGMHSLSISANPTCTSPGDLASQYADNYSTMFSISSIVSQ